MIWQISNIDMKNTGAFEFRHGHANGPDSVSADKHRYPPTSGIYVVDEFVAVRKLMDAFKSSTAKRETLKELPRLGPERIAHEIHFRALLSLWRYNNLPKEQFIQSEETTDELRGVAHDIFMNLLEELEIEL